MKYTLASELERSLGPSQAQLLLTLAERFGTSFTMQQIRAEPDIDRPSLKRTINELVIKGWLLSLGREAYMLAPLEAGPDSRSYALNRYEAAAVIAGNRPYFLSHRTAMEIHDMTIHPWRSVYVSTSARLRPRAVQSFTIRPVTVPAERLWGWESVEVTPDRRVNVSTLARTVVDCLNMPSYAGGIGDIALGMNMVESRLVIDELADDALRFNKISVVKRLGVLLEFIFGPEDPALSRLEERVNATPHVLDPSRKRSGHLDPRWKIWMNVPEEELTEGLVS